MLLLLTARGKRNYCKAVYLDLFYHVERAFSSLLKSTVLAPVKHVGSPEHLKRIVDAPTTRCCALLRVTLECL